MTKTRLETLLRNAIEELLEGAGTEYAQDLAGALGMADEEMSELGFDIENEEEDHE